MSDPQRSSHWSPNIVGIGGAMSGSSSADLALRLALNAAREAGSQTRMFDGKFLAQLPILNPMSPDRTTDQQSIVDAVRCADGVIVSTPVYHAGMSGMVKNALDLLEDLRDDGRPYLDGRAVGCVVTGYGWQACGATLTSLRAVVHALRGWPTPMGAALNVAGGLFDEEGRCSDEKYAQQISIVGRQVVDFALAHQRLRLPQSAFLK